MKRMFCLLLAVLLLSGCSAGSVDPASEPEPASAPAEASPATPAEPAEEAPAILPDSSAGEDGDEIQPQTTQDKEVPSMLPYRTLTEITNNGPYVTKLILPMPVEIGANDVTPETFSVYVERKNRNTGEIVLTSRTWLEPPTLPSKGYREITAAYPSDGQGNRLETGSYATLEMAYGPIYPLGYAQASFGMMKNEWIFSDYRVTQIKEIPGDPPVSGLVFGESEEELCPQMDGWVNDTSHYEALPLNYGYWAPAEEVKRPLVIWLHGAGEGGSDPTIAYTGNKVVNLSGPDIQAKLGGAWILAPQTPTMWMDDGSGQYGRTGRSKYTEALKALIDEFVALHADRIDANRIYIGGCSNGGFMTMRMIIDYPDFFAAAYPVCEALYDETITDENIQSIKDLPIWFVHASNDPVVKPGETVVPTYERLIAAGATNVHFSYYDKVVDDKFVNEKGLPYEYIGHFTWVYVYNDDCHLDYNGEPVTIDGQPVTLFQWMAHQSR